jgi:hypothetical protein
VTRNVRDFQRIPPLTLEDWTVGSRAFPSSRPGEFRRPDQANQTTGAATVSGSVRTGHPSVPKRLYRPGAASDPFSFAPSRPSPIECASRNPKTSVTLIARNEADNIPACLASVKDLADDLVVVDTGSTDDTRAVAAALGARVFDFPWCDSFAAARTEALRHACHPWVLWMDGDEAFDEPNRDKLRSLLAGLRDDGNTAFVMQQRSISPAGAATLPGEWPGRETGLQRACGPSVQGSGPVGRPGHNALRIGRLDSKNQRTHLFAAERGNWRCLLPGGALH